LKFILYDLSIRFKLINKPIIYFIMIDRSTFCYFFIATIMTLFSFFEFSVGISEAVFVSQYSALDNGCRDIWGWILAACVFDISIPVFTCCGIGKLTAKPEDNRYKHDNQLIRLLGVGRLIIAIWSGVTYYHINSSCYNFWHSNAPELWTFVVIHYAMLWIYVWIVVLLIYATLIVCGIELYMRYSRDHELAKAGATFTRLREKPEAATNNNIV
jgi:hypothetical protein